MSHGLISNKFWCLVCLFWKQEKQIINGRHDWFFKFFSSLRTCFQFRVQVAKSVGRNWKIFPPEDSAWALVHELRASSKFPALQACQHIQCSPAIVPTATATAAQYRGDSGEWTVLPSLVLVTILCCLRCRISVEKPGSHLQRSWMSQELQSTWKLRPDHPTYIVQCFTPPRGILYAPSEANKQVHHFSISLSHCQDQGRVYCRMSEETKIRTTGSMSFPSISSISTTEHIPIIAPPLEDKHN